MVKAWLGHIGRTWCGSPDNIVACLRHSQAAVTYLLQASLGRQLSISMW